MIKGKYKRAELVIPSISREKFLFYQAKKGRDLYFSRGWYKRFIALGEWAVAIHDAFQAAKKIHDSELKFDGE